MPSRYSDWFKQAERDLEQAADSQRADRHEWACFAAQQAAEKAVEALHLHKRQEAWGHVVAQLLTEQGVQRPRRAGRKGQSTGQLLHGDTLCERPSKRSTI